MRLPKFLVPLGMALTLAASEAHAQFRDYSGCISFSYKGSPMAEYYKAFISKVPYGEMREAARQPADMTTFEFYGLEVGALYHIEISECRQGPEDEICSPPKELFCGIAKLHK